MRSNRGKTLCLVIAPLLGPGCASTDLARRERDAPIAATPASRVARPPAARASPRQAEENAGATPLSRDSDDAVRRTADGGDDGPDGDDRFDPSPVGRPTSVATIAETVADAPGFSDGIRITQSPDGRPARTGRGRAVAIDPEGLDDGPTGADRGGAEDNQEDTNLDRSRAGRRGGGGGPTDDEDADQRDDEEDFKSDLLVRALGLENSPYGVFGWLQGSFTGNTLNPRNGENFGVNPNSQANAWAFQQLYFVVEKRLDPKKSGAYDWGFRVDSLFGTDWDQFHMIGLFDGAFLPNHFGYDPVQFYGEIHLPWFTPGGVDVKGGRFYALPGYEDGRAPARPLNSGGYLFGYAHPFTHFGVMTTWHVTDRLNFYNGAVNGWDRWIDQSYRWGYAGGLEWDSEDDRTNLSITFNYGPNQFPYFFRKGYYSTINGVPTPAGLAGRRNPYYDINRAFLFTEVLIHEWTEAFSTIVEADQGYEANVPGIGPGGSPGNGLWYGACGWMLYRFHENWTGVYRAEFFRDGSGLRTGFDDAFFEMTLGLIWKPRTWLWFRPELRYDWAAGSAPYNDGNSRSQFTLGFDAIFLF